MKWKILTLFLVLISLSCNRKPVSASSTSIPDWLSNLEPLQDQFTIRQDRPRLYLNRDDLPVLKERIKKSHSQIWARIQAARSSESLRERLLANAFSYLMTGDPKEARLAIEGAIEFSAKATGDDLNDAYRVWPSAVAYDWCYDQLKPGETEKLLGNIKALLEAAGGKEGGLETQPPHAGHLVNHLADAHIPAGIAFYETAPEIYNRALQVTRTQITAKNVYYRFGASSQGNSYGVTHFNGDIRLVTMLLKATDTDLFQRFPYYQDVGYYWIYTRRPDGQILRNGDDWLDSGRHGRSTEEKVIPELSGIPYCRMEKMWTNPWLVEALLYCAAKYRDPYLLNEYLLIRNPANTWTNIIDIIWRDPGLVPEDPQSLPAIRYLDGSAGTLLFRTGWASDDVVGMFKVMPLYVKNHDHLDRLSFQIFCRGALALDSGVYEGKGSGYDSDHWLEYFQRTIAHNCLLIRDPKEKVIYRGREVVADGGLRYPADGANPNKLESLREPQWMIARVLAQETDKGERYAFVTGEATNGYGAKAEEVKRTFIFLKNTSAPGLAASIVIYDQVRSSRPEFEKVWLLHSLEEPVIEGNKVIIRRSGPDCGGTLVSCTLLPTSPRIEKIGGPGKEFWVNGVNYATEKGGDAEGGAWRIEVSCEEKSSAASFLHTLLIYPREPGPVSETSLVQDKGHTGADLPEWTVIINEKQGEAGFLEYYSNGTGRRTHLILGLPADREITARIGDNILTRGRTSRSGSFVFQLDQEGKAIFHISFD